MHVNWAMFAGLRPISMIGRCLARRGYDLEHEFQVWRLDNSDTDEEVIAAVSAYKRNKQQNGTQKKDNATCFKYGGKFPHPIRLPSLQP